MDDRAHAAHVEAHPKGNCGDNYAQPLLFEVALHTRAHTRFKTSVVADGEGGGVNSFAFVCLHVSHTHTHTHSLSLSLSRPLSLSLSRPLSTSLTLTHSLSTSLDLNSPLCVDSLCSEERCDAFGVALSRAVHNRRPCRVQVMKLMQMQSTTTKSKMPCKCEQVPVSLRVRVCQHLCTGRACTTERNTHPCPQRQQPCSVLHCKHSNAR